MKVGDLVYDSDIGSLALILEVKTADLPLPFALPAGPEHNGKLPPFYYVIMYDDGSIDPVFDYEIEKVK
tara:strand:+ start:311 stop:517 length:207 start_codon:yes stop_codon:yes gene_type:complete